MHAQRTHSGADPQPDAEVPPLSLIRGVGEMADRTRAFAWEKTPLGQVDAWPEELLTTVNLLLSSRHPMFLWWGGELIQFYNDAYRPSLGEDKHPSAFGRRGPECWPEIWETIAPEIESVMREGKATWHEDQLLPIYRNGRLEDVYWTYSYSPVWTRGGEVCGTLVTCAETTGRLLAERERDANAREVLATQQRLLEVFQQAPAVVALARGPDHVIEIVNARYRELVGDRPLVGKTVREALPEAAEQGYVAILDHVFQTGEPFVGSDAQFDVSRGDGASETRYLDFVYQPMREADGTIWGVIMLGVDTTERKRANDTQRQAEETLRESEQHLQEAEVELRASRQALSLALDAGRAGTFEWNIERGWITWSSELELLYGVAPGTFEGGLEHWQKRVVFEDQQRVLAEIEAALARHQTDYSYEFRAVLPDGTRRWLRGQSRFLYTEEGRPSRMMGINVDISERKIAEEALLRNEKLAAVGRLASTIAHEINNPLESVTNLLFLLRNVEDETMREYVDTAERELRRVSAIANQTLRFHRQSTKPVPSTCVELIASALSIYEGKLVNSKITVEKRKRAGCPVVCFDGEIRQVLSNLIGNAIDAMHPDGGRLLLRSREGTDWRTDQPGLVITVADTGVGISAQTAQRVFEAFYTTKGIGGTGLGLWLSKEIIERHKGRLMLRSSQREGCRGTVFTVFLPFEAGVA